ncbi:MAG: hypothetical protein ACXVXM_09560 [Nocardioidaceae bacterium]
MEREERFDSFYRATRAQLLHQAFVLTGDLPAATSAVRDAYVAAWQHWRKVSRLEDPLTWVRPRAWDHAQRRHTARIWHRNKGMPEDHKAALDTVAKLPYVQRRLLLLTALAGVPLPEAARELGLTPQVAERHLQSATTAFAAQLGVDGVDSALVRAPLLSLDDELRNATLPRASIVRRAGRKRRRSHGLAAVVSAVAVSLAAGAVAYQPHAPRTESLHLLTPRSAGKASVADATETLPTAAQMLDRDQIRRLGIRQRWHIDATDHNTSGDGINTICQQARFADPDGLSAIVRRFSADGAPRRTAVQTVEVSRSEAQARRTFRTTLGWYADCRLGRLQLLNAYRVNDIGDQANVLMVRVWKKPVKTYSVAVARLGTVTTTTVGETVGAAPPSARQITQSLADSVAMICGTGRSASCSKVPTYTTVPPPPSGEEKGILAVADLPPVGNIDYPWVGTQPQPAGKNPSMTTCDRADFVKGGARTTRTRTFLIPQAKLPARFGLSETYGVFADRDAARRFLAGVRSEVAGCEHRDLATKVSDPRMGHAPAQSSGPSGAQDLEWASWDLSTEVTQSDSVRFRLGFVRVGDKVAQLTFAPAPADDMSAAHFLALLRRAGDRLEELSGG